MRWVYRLALTLAVIAPLHAPAFAAEPEAPAVLIGATEAIRIAIQNRLSAKFTAGVSCPHCFETRSDEDRERYAERHRQVELAQARGGKRHIGS